MIFIVVIISIFFLEGGRAFLKYYKTVLMLTNLKICLIELQKIGNRFSTKVTDAKHSLVTTTVSGWICTFRWYVVLCVTCKRTLSRPTIITEKKYWKTRLFFDYHNNKPPSCRRFSTFSPIL